MLSLEGLGLLLVVVGLWMLGEHRLTCERSAEGHIACLAEVRRVAWLLTPRRQELRPVVGVDAAAPSLGSDEHWLRLDADGEPVRVLSGTARRTAEDVERLRRLVEGDAAAEPVVVRRADWPVGLALIAFGATWVLVISLIMREFLGFHTPWWWRVVGRRR
ncbi:MAG: hypothetical protein AAGC60_09460 [Acidobacteriota bacterium]